MNDTAPSPAPSAKLPWQTPRLEPLGSMRDVKAGNPVPPLDGAFQPNNPSSPTS